MAGSDNIKKIFLQKKNLKRSKRRPILRRLDAYYEILVVSNSNKKILSDSIKAVFKNAKISFLSARKEKEDESSSGDYTYNIIDLNLTGKIKNEKLNRLMQIKFDLILDLSTEDELSLFFLSKLNQSFMIGEGSNSKSHMYDLLIPDASSDIDFIKIVKQQITLLSQNGDK